MRRRTVFVSTGNAYADPVQPLTDAIVAIDVDSGKVNGRTRERKMTTGLEGAAPVTVEIWVVPKSRGRISISRHRRFWRLPAIDRFSSLRRSPALHTRWIRTRASCCGSIDSDKAADWVANGAVPPTVRTSTSASVTVRARIPVVFVP